MRSEATEASYALPPRQTKGLNLLVSGLMPTQGDRVPVGFLIGGGFEMPAGSDVDLNLGLSFQRLTVDDGPLTMVSVVDVTAARRAPHSVFFGAGVGPMFALGTVRPAARLFGGLELFHQGPVPVQAALELIMKFCDGEAAPRCPAGEKQTWLAGRLGFRL